VYNIAVHKHHRNAITAAITSNLHQSHGVNFCHKNPTMQEVKSWTAIEILHQFESSRKTSGNYVNYQPQILYTVNFK